jgi:hypothetical protein
MDLSDALELGAHAAQHVVEVLVERGGFQFRPPVPADCCCLSALVTVGHDLSSCKARTQTLWGRTDQGGDVVLALARAVRVPLRKPVDDHVARPASRQAHRDIATRAESKGSTIIMRGLAEVWLAGHRAPPSRARGF